MSTDQGLTGRDVIAKTFSTRTRRGYDPIEVDAYLEQLATQIDAMHAEIERLRSGSHDFSAAPPPPPPPLEFETAAPEVAPIAAPPSTPVDSGAGSEAAELVLRMAQKASGEAIEEAKARADEIVADAEFKASEVQREADRKAFDVSTRTQGELRAVETEIETKRSELDAIHEAIANQRTRLRRIGAEITRLADGIEEPSDSVIDLSSDAPVPIDAEADTADVGR
ncbi:MAG: DivIVA domain-containing protein [Acidimicrobiia bacterium]|nr:DivIVA domain-containing protein [Acidimicrobiia bacterium]